MKTPLVIEFTVNITKEGKKKLMDYLDAHKPAENGQQTELPPTGGRQDCIAQNAKNATQGNLLCTDAAQLTARKGN